jgi:hypothetical protein
MSMGLPFTMQDVGAGGGARALAAVPSARAVPPAVPVPVPVLQAVTTPTGTVAGCTEAGTGIGRTSCGCTPRVPALKLALA